MCMIHFRAYQLPEPLCGLVLVEDGVVLCQRGSVAAATRRLGRRGRDQLLEVLEQFVHFLHLRGVARFCTKGINDLNLRTSVSQARTQFLIFTTYKPSTYVFDTLASDLDHVFTLLSRLRRADPAR